MPMFGTPRTPRRRTVPRNTLRRVVRYRTPVRLVQRRNLNRGMQFSRRRPRRLRASRRLFGRFM